MPLLLALLFIAGCSTTGNRSVSAGSPVALYLKGQPGSTSESRYHSSSRILTYTGGQLVKDRKEAVDFTVWNNVVAADPDAGFLQVRQTTISKEGPVKLHDLAFPELNETIEYVVRSTGEVLKAGKFPQSSIFFVPSVPIPKTEVKPGDTWVLEHVWRSSRDGVPLKLEILAILKQLVKCDGDDICADLEISGHVELVLPPEASEARFSSKLWGRMLFGLGRGDVLWSQTRSVEDVIHEKGRVIVNSCMISELKTSNQYKTPKGCEPIEEPITAVPVL